MPIITPQNEDDIVDFTPTLVSADIAGDSFRNDDDRLIIVVTNTGAALDLRVSTGQNANFGPNYPDLIIVIPSTSSLYTMEFDSARFNTEGYVNFIFETENSGTPLVAGTPDITGITTGALGGIGVVRHRRYRGEIAG